MTKKGTADRAWLENYFGLSISRLGTVPASAKARVQAITRLIVDTSTISDGTLHFDRAIPIGASTARDTIELALRAASGNTSTLAAMLRQALPRTDVPYNPVASRDTPYLESIWHHGDHYEGYCVGTVHQIARHLDATETEREHLLATARQLSESGEVVYAVGTFRAKTPDLRVSHTIEIVGLLCLRLRVYAGVEQLFAACRAAQIGVLYVSKDDEQTVRTLADVTCLVPRTIVPFVPPSKDNTPGTAHTLYAELSERQKHQLLAKLSDSHTLIVNEPLPDFWTVFRRLRG